jgi:hypothetical protein
MASQRMVLAAHAWPGDKKDDVNSVSRRKVGSMISEDAALAHAFELHAELQDWEDSDYKQSEIIRGVNWRLHLQLDAVVLRRASDDDLPDAGVIRELEKRGQSKIDAAHEIATLVAEDLWGRMKQATKTLGSGEVSPDGGIIAIVFRNS